MALKGIDISGWQPDINLAKVPADFVIVKATEGINFTSSSFTKQMKAAEKAGRLLGVYHYINGAGAEKEMIHFYNTIKPWLGKAIVCLDWESGGNTAWRNEGYLKKCIEKIKALTKKTIIVYASQSVFPTKLCSETGCKKWIAQYANDKTTGYQSTPWNEGSYSCLIRQYSSHGRLTGYSGNLDLNKAYCTKAEWEKLAGKTATSASKPSTSTPAMKYTKGNYKTITSGLRVRTGAGTNYPIKKKSQLTANGKANSDVNGLLKKNVPLTVSEVKKVGNDYWGKIPSGWVAIEYKGKKYCKKI